MSKPKFKIKKKTPNKKIVKPVIPEDTESTSESFDTEYSTKNTECLTSSKNISSDLDSNIKRLEINDEMGGWVNSDKMNFIDWLNTVYSKMERDTFSEQQLKFNDALSKKDLISNRLKPFFVKEHQHFVMDFLHKKSPYNGLLFYHGLGSGKTAASISTADGLHENGNKIIVMLPASLKTNYLEEIKGFGDALLRQKAYWCKVVLPSRNSTGYKALVDELVACGIPCNIITTRGYLFNR